MEIEDSSACLDAEAVFVHLNDQPVIRVDASGVWERSFESGRARRRVLEQAAAKQKRLCGEVRDMRKRLRQMERQLTTTVAEQNRRAEVAAELKMKRDHDNNKACAKLYRTGKQLSATQSELEEAREKLKESNLALY
eukprot:5716601-Pleurochrysis_carterae.AAC.1